MTTLRPRHLLLSALAALACAAPATAAVPEGADWTEAYIETPGEPNLHADILRPSGLAESAKTPVILAIGPYFAHSGSTAPGQNPQGGPSPRFNDMIEGGDVFKRGYTVVYVDLRGFGASQGCNDFGGRGEQIDVKRAVEWAAAQPWSTGKVGMWGKSYDGWTGVMGLDSKPKGLAAAVIMAPIIDGYRTLYQNGVHYDVGWYGTPALYQSIDAIPPTPFDSPQYFLGAATGFNPACYALNIALQNTTVEHDTPFWRERDLPRARGAEVPVLWSHGFMDANTKPDNFLPVWSTLRGPARAWFGQFDHVRGNEDAKVGRNGFLAEAMRWFDRYLKGDAAAAVEKDPRTEIQEGNGRWRAEAQWPPDDAALRLMPLRTGSVEDMPNNDAEGKTTGDTGVGVWSVSQPVAHETRIAGVPRVTLETSTSHRAHLVALLYDVDPSGTATLMTRAASAVRPGSPSVSFELYPQDWTLQRGHRLGLLVAGSDLDWYNPVHSGAAIAIKSGSLALPFLRYKRTEFLKGSEAQAMGDRRPITVDPAAIAASVLADLPPPLIARPRTKRPGSSPAAKPAPARLRLRVSVSFSEGHRILKATVVGAGGYPVRLTLRRSTRTVASRTVRPRNGRVTARFRLARKGMYRLTASARGSNAPRAASRRLRVR
jgi:predicted acyl esterase